MSKVSVILGPPGTGKTTDLLNKVADALGRGIAPKDIGYISFTVKAADEAKTRAVERFNIAKEELTWFRTLHSLAFRWLKLDTKMIMKRTQYAAICEKLGVDYSGFMVLDEGVMLPGGYVGDRMLFQEGLSRVRMNPLLEQYNSSSEDFSYSELARLKNTLDAYKDSYDLMDFNDMLSILLTEKFLPKFKVLFIDEAQDLSKLQWAVVHKLIANSEEVYIAGDDDQAIFAWAGADPDSLISLPFAATWTVLSQSYRLPAAVKFLSEQVIHRVSSRKPKEFRARDEKGSVVFVSSIEDIDMSAGDWLILARNKYLFKDAEELCEMEGFAYDSKDSPLRTDQAKAVRAYEGMRAGKALSDDDRRLIKKYGAPLEATGPIWHEAFTRLGQEISDYFIACLRRKESITRTPRIKISTIHGAKGGEATNVVVYSDMSWKSFEEMTNDPDNELRVFYVAVTRAKQNLYIIEPKTINSFPWE